MSKICKNCNIETDGNFCPHCGAPVEEIPVTEPVTEIPPQPEEFPETVVEATEPPVTVEPEVPTSQPTPSPYSQPIYSQPIQPVAKSNDFQAGFKQVLNVIKNFFSKNIVEAITAQYGEQLNIWLILLAIPALLSAIGGVIHYANPAVELLNFFNCRYSFIFGRFGYLVYGFLLSIVLEMAFVIVVFFYGKIIRKKDISFKGCANLVTSAYLPMVVITAAYAIFGSTVEFAFLVAFAMFIALLQQGVHKILGDEKPAFWSFFLLIVISLAVFSVASSVLSIPGFIADAVSATTSKVEDIFNQYGNNYGNYYNEFPFYY